jgi:uncharacterized protein (UPF0335 family)
MSKKILVKEAALGKFLQSFFIAKANGKDDEFINKLDKISPKVAAMWDDLNNTINTDIAEQYRYLKSKGFDTSALDDYIKSNNITV